MRLYTWNIDIVLKNSGVFMHCVYEGPENNSGDVFAKIFTNKHPDAIIGLAGDCGKSNTFIRVSEIAVVDISKKI